MLFHLILLSKRFCLGPYDDGEDDERFNCYEFMSLIHLQQDPELWKKICLAATVKLLLHHLIPQGTLTTGNAQYVLPPH